MKWVTLICLLIFSIAAESRHLQKRHHEAGRNIPDIAKQVGIPMIKNMVLVMIAQDFQKCSVDEHLKLQATIMEVVNDCIAHPEKDTCKKPAMTLYHDTVCKEDLEDLYPWTKECCGKEEAERITCFKSKRNVQVKPYAIPNIEEACKEHTEHPEHAFAYYLSNIGTRHGDLYQPAVLGFALKYNQITSECCKADDKQKCFSERMTEVKKATDYVENLNKQKCRVISFFPERVFKALALVQIAQRFPNADFASVHKLTLEIDHLNRDCCRGDAVECMIERLEVTEHICKEKDKFSTQLNNCCEKDRLEQTACILALPHDTPAEGLSKEMKEYYEDEHVCENYQKDKQSYLAQFAYNYARKHQESSPQSCLRVASGYEKLVEKCCAGDNHAECLKQAPLLLEAALKENDELTKQNCGALKTLGFNDYYIQLLVRYFAKMPQVTAPTLVELTGKMAKTGVYCCALAEDKVQTCADEKLDILLGEMCEREQQTFVNENVKHCCRHSYADRRPCFTKLGADADYAPPVWDDTKLHFDDGLCHGSPEEQLQKKMILLVEYLKMKPNCGAEKLKEVVESFRKTVLKCCTAGDHQKCFDEEKVGLLGIITAV